MTRDSNGRYKRNYETLGRETQPKKKKMNNRARTRLNHQRRMYFLRRHGKGHDLSKIYKYGQDHFRPVTTQPSYTTKTDQNPKTDKEIYTTVYFLNVWNTPLELLTMSSSSYHSNALHDSMKSTTIRVVEMGDRIKGTFMP